MVGPDMMTGASGIFAGGDMVPSDRTVTIATGHGKKAARNIDAFLRGTSVTIVAKHPVVTFPMLHLPVFSDAEPTAQASTALSSRTDDFAEIIAGLSEAEARREAQRCLSCGNCFECDNCFAACPEQAIIKLGPGRRYRTDYARCTGCAVCFDQCPCHAIEMISELGA
jgi:Pyruvate/2-oxoacid:ferredoxin oxidoreductase delta subunit